MNIRYLLFIFIFFAFIFSKKKPQPVDFENFNIEKMMPDNALAKMLSVHSVENEFLLDVEIEQIIKNAGRDFNGMNAKSTSNF